MITKQLMSRKIWRIILDEVGFFGSLPFFIFVTLASLAVGKAELFERLGYSFLISFIVILVIKGTHYKDRPQKEEFNIFMEKIIAASFPSSHSLNMTILALLLSMEFPYPGVMIGMALLAVMVYAQRYLTRKHFIADIIGGILIGIAEVIFVVRVL